MREIGGYFGLELSSNKSEYFKEALSINNARNSLFMILHSSDIERVFLPYYICDVILEPIYKKNKEIHFYNISEDFKPIFDFTKLESKDLFLYVNYFGVCLTNVQEILELQRKLDFKLAVDNSQSFFTEVPNRKNVFSFNSTRKFFGVPDGSYLFGLNSEDIINLEKEISYKNCDALLSRLDCGATYGYQYAKEANSNHSNLEPALMSNLSKSILTSIDYDYVKKIRRSNFEFLHNCLQAQNQLYLEEGSLDIPLIYPFLVKDGERLRDYLIKNKVFVAKYWPNTKIILQKDSYEAFLTNNLLALPIDQRYDTTDMEHIVSLINFYYEGGE